MTGATGRRSRRSSTEAGFTLIEIGLVMLIMGVILAIVIPKFQDRAHADLVSHARRLAVTFRYCHDQAILDGRTYRVSYDITAHRYTVAALSDEGEDAAEIDLPGQLGRGITLPEPVGFEDVVMPLTAGKLYEGVAWTNFYPDGFADPTVIHLNNGTESYTLVLEYFGQVHVTDRYQDIDFSAG